MTRVLHTHPHARPSKNKCHPPQKKITWQTQNKQHPQIKANHDFAPNAKTNKICARTQQTEKHHNQNKTQTNNKNQTSNTTQWQNSTQLQPSVQKTTWHKRQVQKNKTSLKQKSTANKQKLHHTQKCFHKPRHKFLMLSCTQKTNPKAPPTTKAKPRLCIKRKSSKNNQIQTHRSLTIRRKTQLTTTKNLKPKSKKQNSTQHTVQNKNRTNPKAKKQQTTNTHNQNKLGHNWSTHKQACHVLTETPWSVSWTQKLSWQTHLCALAC